MTEKQNSSQSDNRPDRREAAQTIISESKNNSHEDKNHLPQVFKPDATANQLNAASIRFSSTGSVSVQYQLRQMPDRNAFIALYGLLQDSFTAKGGYAYLHGRWGLWRG